MSAERKGFTLIEVMVVCVIIGILATVAIPRYIVIMENNRADAAVSIMNMVGTTNRMYAMNHNGVYARGTLTNNDNLAFSVCTTPTPAAPTQAELIGCKYLAGQDWDNDLYQVAAAASASSCLGMSGTNIVACTRRCSDTYACTASPLNRRTTTSPYNNWGYTMDVNGVITPVGNAPMPTQ